MCRTASQAFPLLVVAVVMVVVGCVGTNLSTSPHTQSINQQEIMLAITVNQMALLNEMNASSSVCASRESELQELRLMQEATVEQLEGMKTEAMEELERMKAKTTGELEAMKEMMEEMKEVLEVVQNTSLVQPSQQPSRQPGVPDLHIFHNDTSGYMSLCNTYKVLHGSRGSLSPSHPLLYSNNKFCSWNVILPEGTRPVFTWEYLNLESCGHCGCDWVIVWAPGVVELPKICGNSTVATHPMYSIMDNEFTVLFRSDTSQQRKGFILHYAAELVPQLTA